MRDPFVSPWREFLPLLLKPEQLPAVPKFLAGTQNPGIVRILCYQRQKIPKYMEFFFSSVTSLVSPNSAFPQEHVNKMWILVNFKPWCSQASICSLKTADGKRLKCQIFPFFWKIKIFSSQQAHQVMLVSFQVIKRILDPRQRGKEFGILMFLPHILPMPSACLWKLSSLTFSKAE